jgi:hypothetical protein
MMRTSTSPIQADSARAPMASARPIIVAKSKMRPFRTDRARGRVLSESIGDGDDAIEARAADG